MNCLEMKADMKQFTKMGRFNKHPFLGMTKFKEVCLDYLFINDIDTYQPKNSLRKSSPLPFYCISSMNLFRMKGIFQTFWKCTHDD